MWLGNKAGSDERICREYNINWTNEPFNILDVTLSASLYNLWDLKGTKQKQNTNNTTDMEMKKTYLTRKNNSNKNIGII